MLGMCLFLIGVTVLLNVLIFYYFKTEYCEGIKRAYENINAEEDRIKGEWNLIAKEWRKINDEENKLYSKKNARKSLTAY
jgi:hypothetical protein